MSIKILQSEGQVLPISGKLCNACKDLYDQKFGGKQPENLVVFLPRTGKSSLCDFTDELYSKGSRVVVV